MQRGMGTAAAASVPIGERYRGTKCTGEILGREREGGGEEEGVGGVGVRGKPGSKARRNFQQSRSLCWRAAKGVASRVYIMLLWRIPSLFLATLTHRLRIPVVKIALQVKTALPASGGEEERSLLISHFFHFSPHFVSFARFHFDRAEYIYIKRKRVVEYVGLVLS